MTQWRLLPLPDLREKPVQYCTAVRLNSLGSLFFFAYHTLKKDRLRTFHRQLCTSLETEDLHLVLEAPMGHFKTTLAISLSIWWAIPFTETDEVQMRHLGYGDAWIRFMRNLHNQNTRTLIAHEIEARAIDMGKDVDSTYQNNDLFQAVFPEVIPDASCVWNDHTKFHKRDLSKSYDSTNPTYSYKGVGQALQGVHPDSTIQDDNFGRAAQSSMLRGDGRVAEDLIRWHQQLSTRLDTAAHQGGLGLGRQFVDGNRWGHVDLNSWIRENQGHFKFETHSAEGGCCELHPPGIPIFPEEWPMERLQQKRKDLSAYDYAHFYLNQSVLPEECIFKPEWLRYFRFKQSQPNLDVEDPRNILLIEHEAYEGQVIEDFQPGALTMRMIVDVAHAKKTKRCDHCIIVVGYDPESSRLYLLDLWAEPTQYSELVNMIYKVARRWQLKEFWLETVAAQNILKFYLDERNDREKNSLRVNELPYDNSENAKKNRIEGLEPLLRNNQIWSHRSHTKWTHQVSSYPAGLVDVLDSMGYVPRILDVGMSNKDLLAFLRTQQSDFESRSTTGSAGY